jgi:hypothetical protein
LLTPSRPADGVSGATGITGVVTVGRGRVRCRINILERRGSAEAA